MGKKSIQLFSLFLVFMVLLLHNKSALGRLSSGGANGSDKTGCLERERQALLKFKEGLSDDSDRLSSWDSKDMNCCKWSGIRCSNSTGRVAVLDLHCDEDIIPPCHPLRGRINSPSLLVLQHLKYLDLARNGFEGNIPEFNASFSRLQHLNLSSNLFSGPIPHQLGNLSNLQYLDLGFNAYNYGFNAYNYLSGGNLEWLSHLSLLRHLDLSAVNLSKVINWVESVSNLPLLENLHLSNCNLPDVIPPVDLSNSSSSIAVVDLFGNHLSNSIYNWLFNLSRSSSLVSIDLSGNQLNGTIPNAFGNISDLRYLDLSYNRDLSGGNLKWLSHLSLLRHLDLTSVNLSKAINWVESVGNLPQLENLHLPNCNLPDVIPPVDLSNSSSSIAVVDLSENDLSNSIYNWLFNLSCSNSFVSIDLSGNQLNGSIPDAFGSMVSLVYLDLYRSQLEGSIPNSFTNLSHLQSLDLSMNFLSENLLELLQKLSMSEDSLQYLMLGENRLGGKFPDFTIFSSLEVLVIGSNQLTGTVPESIGQLSKLRYLGAGSNCLEGKISEAHFSNLSSLRALDFSFSFMVLELSSNWVPPFQLYDIRLSACNLGPHFPMWLQHQDNIEDLDISENGISGTIPSWFWDLLPSIRSLNLSHNQLEGFVPDLSSKSPYAYSIDLSSNCFTGQLPHVPSNVEFLDLSKNNFSGTIFFLCAITAFQLLYLDLSSNLLSGALPNCWQHFESLMFINLANNSFSGELPSSMSFLYSLRAFKLSNNDFSGELPKFLKNNSNLIVINLKGNRFTGKIPTWIGTHLLNLVVLSLRSNKLYGSIPREICHISCLHVLDLSQNDLSGKLPQCFNNFSDLVNSSSGEAILYTYGDPYGRNNEIVVQWKGQEREYVKNQGLLKIIDLSSNKLSGKVPEQIASLAGLVSLNLSRNNFTGKIMKEIGQMKMLEALDLSSNRISGEIPTSLALVSSLSVLNLSNNSLSGKIPWISQLQTFNADAFSGNPLLCGVPLPKKCPGEGTIVESPVTTRGRDKGTGREEDRFVTQGFYISMGLGFAHGFWAIFGTILLNRRYRFAYFNFLESKINWLHVKIALNIDRLRRKL